MPNSPAELILASSSPRRKEILSRLGLPFRIVAPAYQEHSNPAYSAEAEARCFAEGKALSIAKDLKNTIVIGSDTLIEFEGEKIGKPESPQAAQSMLKRLQGKSHIIWTAVFLIDTTDGASQGSVESVAVTMYPIKDNEISKYVETGEPLDKAGSYAVQGIGQKFIKELKGDRLAAIGLPLQTIAAFLRARYFNLPKDEHLL